MKANIYLYGDVVIRANISYLDSEEPNDINL
jgi:hypothetical protein